MKSIWKGAISFGLVNIPVKLFSAVQDSSLDLDMLDKKDHSHIRFKRVNESTGREVSYENIVKAYKLNGEYVVLEPEDFEAADAKRTHTIEILSFTGEEEVDPIYYEQPYFLEPEKSGVKAYALLRDALSEAGKVGVASFVLRSKETLAILKPYGRGLVLGRIRFEEEIRDIEDLNLPPSSKAKGREQTMARQLIRHLSAPFDISKYRDEYSGKLLKVIRQKAKGVKTTRPKLKLVHTKADDLMEMLKASLGEGKKRRKAS